MSGGKSLLPGQNLSFGAGASQSVDVVIVALQMTVDVRRHLDARMATPRGYLGQRDTGFQQHLKLLNPQPRVDRVLEMVGFKRFLEVYTDLDTAVASFGS